MRANKGMKKMNQRVVILLLVLCVGFLMTGCSSDDKNIREYIIYVTKPEMVILKDIAPSPGLSSLIKNTDIGIESITVQEGEATRGSTAVESTAKDRNKLISDLIDGFDMGIPLPIVVSTGGEIIIKEISLFPQNDQAKQEIKDFLTNRK